MKAQIKVRPTLIIEVEEDKQVDLFRSIASAYEVFGEAECGKCKNKNLTFRTRKNANDDEFFEVRCPQCFAVLQISQNKKGGTLYPNRHTTDDAGERTWLPDNGWVKWDKDKQKMV